jgi:hypothetical protein
VEEKKLLKKMEKSMMKGKFRSIMEGRAAFRSEAQEWSVKRNPGTMVAGKTCGKKN